MRRREFIGVLGGAAAWPLTARGQQPSRLQTIGVFGAASRSTSHTWIAAFVQRLRDLGWIEGRNVAIEYRWAEGHNERYTEIAAELVRLKVDVIFAPTTPGSHRGEAGNIDHPNRLGCGVRPGWRGPSRGSRATRR